MVSSFAISKLREVVRLLSLRNFVDGFSLGINGVCKSVYSFVRGVPCSSVSEVDLARLRAETEDLKLLSGTLELVPDHELREFIASCDMPAL